MRGERSFWEWDDRVRESIIAVRSKNDEKNRGF